MLRKWFEIGIKKHFHGIGNIYAQIIIEFIKSFLNNFLRQTVRQ